MTVKEKGSVDPTMDELIWLFNTDGKLWLDGTGKHLSICLNKFSDHKPRLNSAIHQTFQTINVLEAFQIRDECLPMLRFFIER